MYTIHEGEIVFKEKYGSSPSTRLYVKPPEQENIVTVAEDKREDLIGIFTKIFLPQGYPDSVSKDYVSYQVWDTAQAFCSTITGTLATQEVLRGVGVGDTNATPLAATITWVLKDGCGHLGRIFFAYSHGTYLDAYSKMWRLYADTLNDAAMCLELALPLFKDFTTMILCVTTVMKAIVGVAGGATRAAMTQHHAIRGNMADVSAKDSAQETAVNLVASIAALLIITTFGNSIAIFAIMIIFHIIFNYSAVRAVCLRTLNEPRFLELIKIYLKEELISTPCEINKNEPIVFYQIGSHLLDLQSCGFKIKLGHSMKQLMKDRPKSNYLQNVRDVYECRNYILLPDIPKRNMYVVLRDTANINDTLCAYFHAVLLSIIICAINGVPLDAYKHSQSATRPFAQICTTLQQVDWSREDSNDVNAKFKFNPSIELMSYVDKIANKEWVRIITALTRTGWDLSKHLLIVDEWRLCTAKIVTKSISADNLQTPGLYYGLPSKVITFDDTKIDLSIGAKPRYPYMIEPEKENTSDPSLNSNLPISRNLAEIVTTAKGSTTKSLKEDDKCHVK